MNKTHLKVLQAIEPELSVVKRFKGGMSNFTYLVQNDSTDEKFVFRYPGNGAGNFVNYEHEEIALNEAFKLGLTSETIFFDSLTGVKLAKYVDGENFIDGEIDYQLAYEYMKKFHNSNFENLAPYDHFGRLTKYEALHSNHKEQYDELKAFFTDIYETCLVNYIGKPCHNDSQLANFIKSGDEVFLVDFEYAALNDPIYDYACFGNVDLSHSLDLIEIAHFTEKDEPIKRLYAWRMFQCLQWFNVASYKHDIGLGEALGIDFNAVSNKYITLANTLRSLILSLDEQ